MEEYQPTHFWVISSEQDPGRIEVPVDAGSDIVRPIRCGDFEEAMASIGKVSCESPVDIMDANHYRSISAMSTSTTASLSGPSFAGEEPGLPDIGRLFACQERECSLSLSDQGCPSRRSYDSMSDGSAASDVDVSMIIREFDSLMRTALPEIRVRRAFRGRQSLLNDFDFGAPRQPRAPHKGAFSFESSAKRTDETKESMSSKAVPKFTGFGDLKRRISRFLSTKPGQGTQDGRVAGTGAEEVLAGEEAPMDTSPNNRRKAPDVFDEQHSR